MKRLATLAGGALAVLCIVFFAFALRTHWAQIRALSLGPGTWVSLAGALACYLATMLTTARSWQLVLRAIGHRMAYAQALRVLLVSQFAKYLPGNVGHHFGRVLLARQSGVATDTAITSLAIDTLLALAAGGACALGVLHLLPDIAGRYGETVARNVLVGMVLLVALGVFACLLPGPRRHVAALLQRCAGLLAPGNRLASAQAFATDVGSFVLGAAALGMIATALSPGAHIAPLELLGVYAVAWLVGFLVPGAPAGLGVRETLLILGLGPALGQEVATAATALLRVVTVSGDGLAFAAGTALARRRSTA